MRSNIIAIHIRVFLKALRFGPTEAENVTLGSLKGLWNKSQTYKRSPTLLFCVYTKENNVQPQVQCILTFRKFNSLFWDM